MITFAYWVLYILGAIAALMIVAAIIPSWRWAIYGNDDDGIYGDAAWRTNYKKRWWAFSWWSVAVVWWARNPCRNFFWEVLSRDPVTHFWIYGKPGVKQVQRGPDTDNGHRWLFAVYDHYLPQVAYRGKHLELHVGFRAKEWGNTTAVRWGFVLRWRKAS